MNICIIILNFNGKKDTIECIESLKKLNHSSFEILVVDNGSVDNSLSDIKKIYPDILYLDNKKNLGFAEGNNKGIEFALKKFDAILILNNDTIVDQSLLFHFETFSKKHPKSILGAKVYQYYQRDTLDHLGGLWNNQTAQFDLIGANFKEHHQSFEKPLDLDYVCGCALFARTEVFHDIGFFDPRFFLFWEESDFCFRAKQKGYDILFCPKAKLWHKVSASFTGGKPHTTYFWWRNRLLWMEKNLKKRTFLFCILKTITPEIFKLLRHRFLKKIQLLFTNQKKHPDIFKKRSGFLITNRAALCGIKDYIFRNFYEGPSWIFQKISRK